jgi:hypothetical protein
LNIDWLSHRAKAPPLTTGEVERLLTGERPIKLLRQKNRQRREVEEIGAAIEG